MLSGHLASQLNARQLDLAVVFQADAGRRWHVTPLLDEKLFVIAVPTLLDIPEGDTVQIGQLGHVPLVMPSAQHGLRTGIITAFERSETVPHIVMEIDGLATLMQAVKAGHAATIQPGAAAARLGDAELRMVEISDDHVGRRNFLASLSDDELSPAALATRVVLLEVSRELVNMHLWPGASLQLPEALHQVGL
jgi:LysR family tcuABC transcriptional regulator